MVSRGYKFRLHDALKAAEEEEDLTAEFTNYKDAFRASPRSALKGYVNPN